MYDVLIIGGGISGTAIARRLSRYKLKLALLEAQNDVAMGATKANSAIVHGGYAEAHAKLKGRLCYKGRRQFAALNEQLNFGFKPVGSLVLAFEEEQKPKLEQMLENGRQNGLDDLRILDHAEIIAIEPSVNSAVVAALYCEGAGVCSPFEMAIALAENAVENGLELFLNSEVAGIEKTENGYEVRAKDGARYEARYVVNAAGLAAAKIADMAGAGGFEIHPRSGEYIIMNSGSGDLVKQVLFQMPTKMGKGILATPTVYGNLMLGPDAIDERRDDRSTHAERLYDIYTQALQSVPDIDISRFLRSYAGVRPVADTDDFIISEDAPGFVNVAGIQSPGLTSSPAVADRVADILKEAGLALEEDPAYQPKRKGTHAPHPPIPAEEMKILLEMDPGDDGRMVCRCEQVAESTIYDAAHRGIALHSVDAVKRRTHAGAGLCQGTFCRPRTAALLSDWNGEAVDSQTDFERAGLHRVNRAEMLAYYKEQQKG